LGVFVLADDFTMDVQVQITLDPRWRAVGPKITQAIEIAARNVEKGGKDRITAWPAVDTSRTVNSIQAKPVGISSIGRGLMRGENLEWEIGPNTDYSAFIEFGTRYMRPRPFMVPALEDERPRLIKALSELLRGLT
jgi:HK97 gp10 family phage protein